MTGTWSPCGFSMIETLAPNGHPGGRRRRSPRARRSRGRAVGGAITFGGLARSARWSRAAGGGGRRRRALAAAIGAARGVRSSRRCAARCRSRGGAGCRCRSRGSLRDPARARLHDLRARVRAAGAGRGQRRGGRRRARPRPRRRLRDRSRAADRRPRPARRHRPRRPRDHRDGRAPRAPARRPRGRRARARRRGRGAGRDGARAPAAAHAAARARPPRRPRRRALFAFQRPGGTGYLRRAGRHPSGFPGATRHSAPAWSAGATRRAGSCSPPPTRSPPSPATTRRAPAPFAFSDRWVVWLVGGRPVLRPAARLHSAAPREVARRA